jgi:transaldolase
MTETRPLQRLAELGQSVWIDFLSRKLLASGELARLVREDAVVGVTSNPTIFEKATADGDAYDEQLRALIARELNAKDVFLELACADVAAACELLRPVWEQTRGRDGYVSIEVDPNLAYDTLAQYEEAKRLHERIARPNLLVKIPATRPGVAAIADSIAAGRSINVTLVFSVERYVAAARAYIDGLTRFQAAGGDVATVHSVASFFVSRVDSETDRRLDALGAPPVLKGKLGIANAKLAYERYRELFSPDNERWAEPSAAGAPATLLVGVHLDQEPRPTRRALRRRADRPRDCEHAARTHPARLSGPRPRRTDARAGTRRSAPAARTISGSRRRLRRRRRDARD